MDFKPVLEDLSYINGLQAVIWNLSKRWLCVGGIYTITKVLFRRWFYIDGVQNITRAYSKVDPIFVEFKQSLKII